MQTDSSEVLEAQDRQLGFTPVWYANDVSPAEADLDCAVTYMPVSCSDEPYNLSVNEPRVQFTDDMEVLRMETLTIKITANDFIDIEVPVIDYPGQYPVLGKDFFKKVHANRLYTKDNAKRSVVAQPQSGGRFLLIPLFSSVKNFSEYQNVGGFADAEFFSWRAFNTSRLDIETEKIDLEAGASILLSARSYVKVNYMTTLQHAPQPAAISRVRGRLDQEDIVPGNEWPLAPTVPPAGVSGSYENPYFYKPVSQTTNTSRKISGWDLISRMMTFCGHIWSGWSDRKKNWIVWGGLGTILFIGIVVVFLSYFTWDMNNEGAIWKEIHHKTN